MAYYKLPVEHSVLVTGVMQNSQAAQARIPSGRILTRLGGSEISNVKDVIKVLNAHNVGDVVDMELIREGARITGQTTIEKAPSAHPTQSMR